MVKIVLHELSKLGRFNFCALTWLILHADMVINVLWNKFPKVYILPSALATDLIILVGVIASTKGESLLMDRFINLMHWYIYGCIISELKFCHQHT